ncbi:MULTISPECIES: hypothetical protein [Haloferax]|uniref:Uncharacterized protein n=1 Tax=Haloferax mediterranei (strain ATCC 33500 / DSM 1411 / JCM 8866 / NBRC 14739 / NCIMB 2177 / R-4) TaxID=523841 RepID=I3R5V7_HALMT|nr:hypothetical protein [Haloferax mediterranei]AFK19617.1 hypothetical protein HFX_1920 [Haloferax mediterranei ATCC 33500]ELZ99936.1 hypothetical protein C439_11393 [Haloferax mediterranei ATCC 33500]MDX5987642.1 hypothetical protein [Haloferax mediterranei ATCC 33500]
MTSEAELEPDPDPESDADAPTDVDEADPAAHLKDLEDGAGCTEIWSHLSESREE